MSVEISEVVIIVVAGTLIVFLLLIFLLTLFFVFQRRQLQSQQEKTTIHARYAQEILQTQIEVQNFTLQQIGQELHDNIGQLLFVAKINLNILEDTEQITENKERITQANEIISLSINELRALTKSFDGDFVKDFGLQDSLAHELIRIRKTKKFQTEITTSGEKYLLGYEKEIVLFRISQEIFNNTMKHAGATIIQVHLTYEKEEFKLEVTDNGKGFDLQVVKNKELKFSGSGLRNMQRRAELIGGKFTLETSPGQGTKIEIRIHSPEIL